jgi:long-chain acyl-CoA synthetase
MQGYGLTETSPVISSNNPINARLGTVGKPIRNVEVRIAEDGEIEVAGPNVMLGYYNKAEATRDAFTEDGWFKTGDIGEIDRDGFLKITDRKKELFKTSGGKYIAPSPIEQMIKSSRFVSQAVLIGNERKFPAALIVPNFEQLENYARSKNLDLKTPKDFCEDERIMRLFEQEIEKCCGNLARYERVKKFALLENELTVEGGELTPTLKVKRRVIDEKYKAVIDKIYSDAEKEKS